MSSRKLERPIRNLTIDLFVLHLVVAKVARVFYRNHRANSCKTNAINRYHAAAVSNFTDTKFCA